MSGERQESHHLTCPFKHKWFNQLEQLLRMGLTHDVQVEVT